MPSKIIAPLRSLSLCTALLLFAGCTLGPDYKSPELNLPENYRDAENKKADAEAPTTAADSTALTATITFADYTWPAFYQDNTLQELIREALRANKDILIASARVQQSRELSRQARSSYYPMLAADGGVSRGRNQSSGIPINTNGLTGDDAVLTLSALWEIDLWGRLRRLDEAARARYLSSDETRRAITLSLISDVAATYYQLLELDSEIAIAHRSVDAFSGSLRIFSDRRSQGVASRLETSRAEAALVQASASIPELQRLIALTENQICLLLGRTPGPIPRTLRFPDVDLVAASIPAGLPADLIARRPDLRASELNLRAANATIGANIAQYYPTIGLSAFLGRVSPDLSSITSGRGNAWSISANITEPIFQGGRLRSQTAQARAAFDEALHQHEKSVLTALTEVSNALINRQKYAESTIEQRRIINSLTDSVKVSQERYAVGKASYYEVLESLQELYPSETTLARTRLNQILSTIALYKALGGGWSSVTPSAK